MSISIVSICYNNRFGLEETWRSVQSQSFQEWEWIVIDGASSDGTQDFLRSVDDVRLHWISEEDDGIYDAMNKGLERVKGEYVVFLNSGDVFAQPDVLAEVVQSARKQAAPDLCYGDSYEKGPSGLLRKTAFSHRKIWYGMFTHHQSMFYRRAFVGTQRYPTHYKIGGDYAFTAQILARGGRAVYLPRPLCTFEKGGLSEQSVAEGRADVWDVQKKILHMSFIVRLGVRVAHITLHTLKTRAPIFYRALRFRKSSKNRSKGIIDPYD